MSSDDRRIGVDDLLAHAEPMAVDSLDTTAWKEAPWSGDVGSRAVQSAVFGNLELVLTHGDVVLHGADRVEAERFEQRDDGMVPVVDLQALGYSRAKAEAAVLSIRTHYDRDRADPHMLAELVTSLATENPEAAVGAGWDGDSIDTLMAALDELEPTELRDDVDGEPGVAPPEPADGPPVTQPRDIWTLGPHRIMCGDCRDPEDVATLLDGATVNLAFTSPPYAHDLTDTSRRDYDTSGPALPGPEEYVDWFSQVALIVDSHLAIDGLWAFNIYPGAAGFQRRRYVHDLVSHHMGRGWWWVEEYAWARNPVPTDPVKSKRFKPGMEAVYVWARSADYRWFPEAVRHESDAVPVYAPGSGFSNENQGQDGRGWVDVKAGMAYPSTLLREFARDPVTGHPAAFPIGLPDFFVRAYTDGGDTVFDPFMGSGSTLLAAHQNDRVGFGMEISPKYCDVICARWELVTGIKPERDGVPHSFVEAV